jgi:S-adenosylmethionine:diacylglycerol 3-amino-3-carboxypropyl transferase
MAAKSSSGGFESGATPAAVAETSAWRRAASALEKHDSRAADRVLEELTAGADANTRDAAWLARAQLWISDGAREKAVPVLRRLATDGATTIIRKRAQDLLRGGASGEPQR